MQRADSQKSNCLQAELRGWGYHSAECWSSAPAMAACNQEPRERSSWAQMFSWSQSESHGAIPALGLSLQCFPPCECNLNPSYIFPLPTSHQNWHPMQTAFRNRGWDTRDAACVLLFITVIPVCRKAYLDAVCGFQRMPWVWVFHSIFGPGW